MKRLFTVLYPVFLISISAFSQPYKYKYFLDKDLASVDSASALFIGKGFKDNSLFLLDGFYKQTGKLFMNAHFTDSSLSILQGLYKSYYPSGKTEQEGNYENNSEQGIWINRDTAGFVTDTVQFDKGIRLLTKSFNYYANGNVRTYRESDSSGKQILYQVYDTEGKIMKDDSGEDMVFSRVEVEAQYPGGQTAWTDYLRKNLNGATPSEHNAPSGMYTVIVRFIVTKEGKVSDIAAETNMGYGMEEEVIRIIKNTKYWMPAIQNGRVVNAYRRQPVSFFIDNGDR